MESLEKYIGNSQIESHFLDLYRLDVFRTILDFTLSLLIQRKLSFRVLEKGFSENKEGQCLSSVRLYYNKVLRVVLKYHSYVVTIRKLSKNVIIHEIAHAVEKASGLGIKDGFGSAILDDLKKMNCGNLILRNAIRKLMVTDLNQYSAESYLSELFVRYFELFALTREASSLGKFSVSEVKNIFKKTQLWVSTVFEPEVKKKILPEVVAFSRSKKTIIKYNFNWQDKTSSLPVKSWRVRKKSLFK